MASIDPASESAARARALADRVDLLIVATRNAHLTQSQQALAQDLLNRSQKNVLLCLRNPYDAGVLTGAGGVVCTLGDSAPSLEAAVGVLAGDFEPAGKLPVPLSMD